jgi:DNA-binding MarR family transcriptional regulator
LKRQVIPAIVDVVKKSSAVAEPLWLDEEEMAAWLEVVGLMFTLPAALDAQLQRSSGLTHFEYMTLANLSAEPSRTLRMSTLAASANASLSRLSHVVKRLEAKGWVFRQPCPEDGRFTNATLTDSGYAKLAAAAPGHVAEVRKLVIDPLSRAQLKQLTAIGRRIRASIENA